MPPALLFSLMLGIIFGLLFHGLFGRRLWQLPCFLITAVAGFFSGQVIGSLIGMDVARIGNVPLAAATAGALVGLAACWFFTSPAPETRAQRRRRAPRPQQPGEQVSA